MEIGQGKRRKERYSCIAHIWAVFAHIDSLAYICPFSSINDFQRIRLIDINRYQQLNNLITYVY